MKKYYQVFVSSTYEDLIQERQEVMHALLELDCIPSGMELFQAADEDQWSTIKRVISECDYYIVIVGGRYGALGPSGKSYTHMEYEYAIEIGKPVIAFLHKDPGSISSDKTEKSDDGKRGLTEFKKLIEEKMCRYWINKSDLGGIVSRSIVNLKNQKPAVGWVRGDMVSLEDTNKEILALKRKIESLENELAACKVSVPQGIEEFAQGEDTWEFKCKYIIKNDLDRVVFEESLSHRFSWNQISAIVLPFVKLKTSEYTIKQKIEDYLIEKKIESIELPDIERKFSKASIFNHDLQTILIQLGAIGLIYRFDFSNWLITTYGESVFYRVTAIKRQT